MKAQRLKKYILVFAVTAAALAWILLIPTFVEKSYLKVDYSKVKVSNVVKAVNCKGKIEATRQDKIAVGIPVKVSQKNFSIGDKVQEGQKLIEIDKNIAKQTLFYGQALSSVGLSEFAESEDGSTVSKEQAASALDQALGLGLIDKNTYDEFSKKIENSDGNVSIPSSLSAMAQSLEGSTDETISDLNTSLCSKISGVVTSIKDSSYGILPSSTVLATVVDMSSLQVTAQVTEDDVKNLKVGQDALIYSESFDGVYTGKVKTISPVVNTGSALSGSGNYVEVEIKIDNPDSNLLPGYTSNVSIKIADKKSAMTVPFDFIKQDDKGNEFVYVYRNCRAVKTFVTTGTDENNYVEIQKGLTKNDYVITDANDSITDGAKVKLKY